MEARGTTRRDRAGHTIVHAGLQEAIRRHTACDAQPTQLALHDFATGARESA